MAELNLPYMPVAVDELRKFSACGGIDYSAVYNLMNLSVFYYMQEGDLLFKTVGELAPHVVGEDATKLFGLMETAVDEYVYSTNYPTEVPAFRAEYIVEHWSDDDFIEKLREKLFPYKK